MASSIHGITSSQLPITEQLWGKDPDEHEMVPVQITRRRSGLRKNYEDEEKEETIGVNEWEKTGKNMLIVPWLNEGAADP